MFVENDVLVEQSMVRGKLTLPGGIVATGLVKDDRGIGVPGCEVRIFGRPRAGKLPELRARTRSTSDGHFMIVLPQSP